MLNRPTPKSAETRARIVRGALLALEEHGLGETTTRRIAAEADVRLATLHYHFASKESLLLAVFEGLLSEMTDLLGEGAALAQDLDSRIASLVRAAWSYVLRTRAKQIVQYELTLYALRTQGAEWLAAKQYRAYADLYQSLLRTDILGPVRLDLGEADIIARMMVAGMDGLILQYLASGDDQGVAHGLDALIEGVQSQVSRLVGLRSSEELDP